MMNALLALFNRSLRQDSRAKSTYWARAGLVSLICVMMITTRLSMGWIGAPGLQFFATVISTNYLFISLAGLSFFSSAITEEKEEMTLGLLRMTNLNPLSILLGKSTSRLFSGLLLLAVQLPFTLLAISFGGISLVQILASYCALMAYVIFLSNLALFASVVSARTAGAAILTGFLLVLFLFGHYFTLGILSVLHWMGMIRFSTPGTILQAFLNGWKILLPSTRFEEVLSTGFSGSLLSPQIYGNLALGLLFFAIAWASFDFFCRDEKDSTPRRFLFRPGPKTVGIASAFRIFNAGRAWKAALIWKDFHFLAGGKLTVFIKLLLYLLLPYGGILLANGNGTLQLDEYGYTYLWSMVVVFFAELVVMAGRIFRQERRWQTLSSLAMLPISIRRLAYQKVLGCLVGCWPTFLIFLGGCLLLLMANWADAVLWWSNPNRDILHSLALQLDWRGVGAFVGVVALVLFFLHLVVDLSLRFKWGALPLAIGITWLLNMIALPFSIYSMGEASFVAIPLALIAATIFLHFRIGLRLEKIAGEE
ncbi:MAG: hypothetical protein JWL59_4083 [Chthoniobacteraceae bacterium]|nr:hypothetical protein [Chthoniobacteraceae bacterium]